jgi:hypothetical protein
MIPPFRLGPNDLLEYVPQYAVLICRECRYAIQKGALQSHLLRHKVYREQRQRLLSSIAQLNLLEPHQVPLPTPGSLQIDALPIISGYGCTADGCKTLCASIKRMRRHRSEIHGRSGTDDFSDIARSVTLQTFFRGTKIQYFEVTPSQSGDTANTPSTLDSNDGVAVHEDQQGRACHKKKPGKEPQDRLSLPSCAPMPFDTTSERSAINFDLESLRYFHHYTTITSLTLLSIDHVQSAAQYWQTEVVLLALQRRWLMCGLLAISAVHTAALAPEVDLERVHRERAAQFYSEFIAEPEHSFETDDEAVKAGKEMRRVLSCTQDLIVTNFVLHSSSLAVHNAYSRENAFSYTSILLHATTSPIVSLSSGTTHSTLLRRLASLPARMTEAFERPEDTGDVLDILAAIATLIECYSASFASDDADVAWREMTGWWSKIPSRFHHILSYHPAALVVLAHWAATLVKQAEHCGCWFLRGSTKAILSYVDEKLPKDNSVVRSLVEGLG